MRLGSSPLGEGNECGEKVGRGTGRGGVTRKGKVSLLNILKYLLLWTDQPQALI